MKSRLITKKKGEVQFWMVMLILGLIAFLIIVIIQTGAVQKFIKPIDLKKKNVTTSIDCLVPIGSDKDKNNDGINDVDAKCKGFSGESLKD